jgi:hypothetical protein
MLSSLGRGAADGEAIPFRGFPWALLVSLPSLLAACSFPFVLLLLLSILPSVGSMLSMVVGLGLLLRMLSLISEMQQEVARIKALVLVIIEPLIFHKV